MDTDKRFNIVDEETPVNEFLSGHYKKSFGHYTMSYRLPVILTRIIDNLSRDKEALMVEYGENCRDDIKDIIGHLSKLKYELQTDKPFKMLPGDETDQKSWNDFIANLHDLRNSYFSAVWLHAECYLYRRLKSTFEESSQLKNFDYFRKQKEESYLSSKPAFINLAIRLNEIRQSKTDILANFRNIMKVNLWGNRIDLSLSGGENVTQHRDPFHMVEQLESFILADHIDEIWKCLSANDQSSTTIDLIHDNAGYELFTDFCLIDFILSQKLATKIRCHVKMIPWFVSDVIPHDFQWTIETLKNEDDSNLKDFGNRLSDYIARGEIECTADYFWTSAYDFDQMKKVNENLYNSLSSSKLLIFKGDLNYRKLMGDINWDPTTPFSEAIRCFKPTNICALRTVKADTVSGLKPGVAEELNKKDPKWMGTGEYGLIQFSPK